MQTKLPICEIFEELKDKMNSEKVLLIEAPTGAGKSTALPLYLAKDLGLQKIYVIQPRRLAAKNVAMRLAELWGESVGESIGFRTRFESVAGKKIEVLTDGVFLRVVQNQPELLGVSAVLFDEFHERTLAMDLSLALVREVKEALREDLKILLLSATLDSESIAQSGNFEFLQSRGRTFPLQINYLTQKEREPILKYYGRALHLAMHQEKGDVLFFLPGKGEIYQLQKELAGSEEFDVYPLHGSLPYGEQKKALENTAGVRRVILATNIAETSLTIAGIRIVIDSGWERRTRFEVRRGRSVLEKKRISLASANQRAGRAGRTESGVCFRLWSSQEKLLPQNPAEIENSDLSSFVLELAHWGETDAQKYQFLTPPNPGFLERAQRELTKWGMLEKLKMNSYGKAILNFPMHPRLTHFVLQAAKMHLKELAIYWVLLLEGRELLGHGKNPECDFKEHFMAGLYPSDYPSLNKSRLVELEKEFARWGSLAEFRKKMFANNEQCFESLLKLWLQIYPQDLLKRKGGSQTSFRSGEGFGVSLAEGLPLGQFEWLIGLRLDGNLSQAKLQLGIALPEGIQKYDFPQERELLSEWRDGKLVFYQIEKLLGHELKREKIAIGAEELREAILPLFKNEWRGILLGSLAKERKHVQFILEQEKDLDKNFWSDEYLVNSVEEWLLPYWNYNDSKDLFSESLVKDLFYNRFNWDVKLELLQRFPMKYILPSGREVEVHYGNGRALISGKLQEFFGLNIHPSINQGRLPLTIEVLSPARRGIQLTCDLPGFWQGSYTEVRKEMKGRYPRHNWSETPWSETASVHSIKNFKPM